MNTKKLVTFPLSKYWSTLLLASIVLFAMLYSCNTTQEEGGDTKQKYEAIKVIAFGGTVTDGTSAKLDLFHDCFQYGTTTVNKVRKTQTWWAIMERILRDWVENGVEVISAGSAGNTAVNGVARIDKDVLSHSPDYVLVMFGMDDALAGVEADNFRKDLEKIVNRIEEGKVKVFLMTPPPISERMTVNCMMEDLRGRQAHLTGLVQVIRDLAEEKSLPLIDFYQYFLGNRLAYDHLFEGWLPDGVAQSAMAPFVAGKLLPLMGVNNYPNPNLCDYRKVYSDAKNFDLKHSGFATLTFFKGQFYLGFRASSRHIPPEGEKSNPIVMRSADGINWERDAILQMPCAESGRPEFLKINGHLFAYVTGILRPQKGRVEYIKYGFEKIGLGKWSKAFECAPGVFWHPKKWQDQYIAAAYATMDPKVAVKLFSSPDGRNWEPFSTICEAATEANETDLWTEGGQLIAYSRAEAGSNYEMLISTYVPSENRWETVSSGRIIQAPTLFKTGERLMVMGRYCAPGDDRWRGLMKDWGKFNSGNPIEVEKVDRSLIEEYHHGLRTGMFIMDGTKPRLVMEFLSAGDCSYTGVVQYGEEYVISDYSMHEYYPKIHRSGDWATPSDIYVYRVRFGQ